jgi:hypothetical protein
MPSWRVWRAEQTRSVDATIANLLRARHQPRSSFEAKKKQLYADARTKFLAKHAHHG